MVVVDYFSLVLQCILAISALMTSSFKIWLYLNCQINSLSLIPGMDKMYNQPRDTERILGLSDGSQHSSDLQVVLNGSQSLALSRGGLKHSESCES